MRVAKPVQLNAEDDRRLRILSSRKRVEARVQMRARIVLRACEGLSDKDIAEKLGYPIAAFAHAGVRAFWPPAWTACCRTRAARGARAPRASQPTSKKWFASRSRRRPKGRPTGAHAPWPLTWIATLLPWPASDANTD